MRVRIGLTVVTVAVVVGLILAGSPAAASPEGRTYNTSYGSMTWSSSGRASYQPTESGLITGSLSGQVFTGQWSETSSARTCSSAGPGGTDHWGRVVFTFSSNFDSFTGVWGYCDDTPTSTWNGTATTRSATPTPRPTPTPVPKCDGKRATISGRSGVINGTSGNDVIVGSPGRDIINGRGGRDTICGRGGNDTISGGGKSDVMIGGSGKDTLVGGKGANDRADGGPGSDACAAERETSCEEEPEIAGPLVTWEMPRRYGERTRGIVYPTDDIDPRRFTVEFSLRRGDGSKCRSTDRVKASLKWGRFSTPDPKKPCEIVGRLFEGTHRVKFTLNTRDGRGVTRERVVVQDWLIVGIGDSNGSGEGTPDKPNGDNARWVNKQCHRSAFSHQALSARQLENADKQTSVTFVHLSCSGAQIEDGLLEPYTGIVPGRRIDPQLDRLKRIARVREVDAVVISAGVNDLHFGEMVTFCVLYERCQHRRWSTFGIKTLDETMQDNLARLPGLYRKLDRRLRRAGISADRVYITDYFNSTTDDNGVRCNPLLRVGGGARDFDQTEATWAAERVLAPLNTHVRVAAARYGWNMISGAEQGFVGHGICAENNWIVTMDESEARQGDANGTLHATVRGNRFQRDSLVPAMRADFYNAAGNPRRPNEDSGR